MSRLAEDSAASGPIGPTDGDILALGKLHYLVSYCPMHRKFPAFALDRLLIPAINNDCVRFFENEDGKTCAALIWARLSDPVSERMIYDRIPPGHEEWCRGHNLWFLDLIAPFGHGPAVARHIARNPPDGPFYFARLDGAGQVRKVVQGDDSLPRKQKVQAFHPHLNRAGRV